MISVTVSTKNMPIFDGHVFCTDALDMEYDLTVQNRSNISDLRNMIPDQNAV